MAACSSSSTPSSTSAAFVATDPPGGEIPPPWTSSASTVGVCTPDGGYIEALPSTNNGSGNVPNLEYPPSWFSCPGATCETVDTFLVQCGPMDDAASGDGEAPVGAEASAEASVDAAAPLEAEASTDTGAPADASTDALVE
jgi:hypothetical protein